MQKSSIQYLGGIDNKDKGVTLTWSATLLKVQWEYQTLSVLIDYGMFQWGLKDSDINQLVDEEALNANCIVLTHAHLDHCGRLPLLVKEGYKNPIFMTDLTKKQIFHILSDHVKIVRYEIDAVSSQNTKKSNLYKRALYIKDMCKRLKENNLSDEDKQKFKSGLLKKLQWKNQSEWLKEAEGLLSAAGIENNWDIEKILQDLPVLFYDEKDIDAMMKLVQKLEIWGEKVLKDYMYITSLDDDDLDKTLQAVKQGYSQPINVDTKLLIPLKTKLNQRIWVTEKAIDENLRITKENNALQEELIEAFNFITEVGQETAREIYDRYMEKLTEYNIESLDDIEKAGEQLYYIKFDLDTLYNTRNQFGWVEIDYQKDIIDAVKLRFLDAWHIEWSIQALITVVTEKIDNCLRSKNPVPLPKKRATHKNLLFTWDLGRFKDPNLAGTPEISDLKLDYLQMETTYAGRVHPEKQESINDFFNAIHKAEWKVVIPCFSMQRTQEILVLLVEQLLEAKNDIPVLKKKSAKLKRIEDELKNLQWWNLEKKRIPARQQAKIDRVLWLKNELKKEIKELKSRCFQYDIILDSPLSTEITNIYTTNLFEKYRLLSNQVQKELLGKPVVDVLLNQSDHNKLYTEKRRNKKEIILSSWWMCQWGSVLNHLKENLWNTQSTIIFVWYCPDNTRGWYIKNKKSIEIEWGLYEIYANVVNINGFSGHLDEEEIFHYFEKSSFARWAKVVLNHGTESRHILANKISEEIFWCRSSVKVLVPSLNDTIEFKL